MRIQDLPIKDRNEFLFKYIMTNLKNGNFIPRLCAKSVTVDVHFVTEEEIGQPFTTYSHGKIEKQFTLEKDMALLTTLDKEGKPVLDENGNKNIYDMKVSKFLERYPIKINGHYAKDPYAPGAVMVAIKLPCEFVDNGITLLPPSWKGYEGTLMEDGILMFPFNPNLTLREQIKEWESKGANGVDWYPNNEPYTYDICDKNGTFKNENLRILFGQEKEFDSTPYTIAKTNEKNSTK